MSQDKKDLPKTGTSESGRNKPAQGETFVKDKDDTVKLTQTQQVFGKRKGS
jgi:hypothetical protein